MSQLKWRYKFSKNDLKDGAHWVQASGHELNTFLVFVGYDLRDPQDFDWTKTPAGPMPCSYGKVGWGRGMSAKRIFDKAYGRDHFRYTKNKIFSPVIEIDGMACDGYGRATIAHARGSKILVAMFKSSKIPLN